MSKLSRFIHFFTTDNRNNDGPTTGWLKRISTPAAVMNITDAVAKPVYDLVIAINPVQDLHGYDSPWPAGGGKNKLDTSNTTHNNYNIGSIPNTLLPNTTYTFSINGTTTYKYKLWLAKEATPLDGGVNLSGGSYIGAGQSATFTTPADMSEYTKLCITGASNGAGNESLSNILPMVELGSSATSYAPYSNVCPITGWTGANIYHSGADTSDPETIDISWQTEAGTVYGGTVDLTTGILTVKTKKVSVASVSGKWNVTNPNGSSFYVSISGSTHTVSADDIPALLSNELLYASSPNNKMALYHFGGNSGGKTVWTIILPDTVADVPGANSWLASNPLEIIVQLETPVTYQLTPTEVKTLLGENNIWADTGNVNSIAYYSTDETCSPLVGSGKVGSMSIA